MKMNEQIIIHSFMKKHGKELQRNDYGNTTNEEDRKTQEDARPHGRERQSDGRRPSALLSV
jgi:hypothetical protein